MPERQGSLSAKVSDAPCGGWVLRNGAIANRVRA
jgi:hypothetical protein